MAFADLKNDYIFRRIFATHPDILRRGARPGTLDLTPAELQLVGADRGGDDDGDGDLNPRPTAMARASRGDLGTRRHRSGPQLVADRGGGGRRRSALAAVGYRSRLWLAVAALVGMASSVALAMGASGGNGDETSVFVVFSPTRVLYDFATKSLPSGRIVGS